MILPKTKTSALILPILTIAMSFFVTNTTYATGNTQDNIVKKSYLQGLGVCYELKNGGTEDDYKEGWWLFISNVTDDNYESMTPDQYQLAGEVTTSTYENDFSYKKLFPKEPAKNKIRLPNGWTPESGDSKTNCAHLVNGGDGFSDTIYDRFNKPEAKIQGSSSADDIKKFMEKMGYKKESSSTENGRKCFTITYDWQKYKINDDDSWRQLSNEKGSEKSSEVCADIENGIVTKLSYPNDTMDARYLSLGVDYNSGGVTIDFVMAYDPENFDYNCHFMNGMNCYPFGSHLDDGGQEDLAYLSIYDKNYSWDQFYDELEKRVNALRGGKDNFSNAYYYNNENIAEYVIGLTGKSINVTDSQATDVVWKLNGSRTTARNKAISYLNTGNNIGSSYSKFGLTESQAVVLYQHYIKDVAQATVNCDLDSPSSTDVAVKWFESATERKDCYITGYNADDTEYNIVDDKGYFTLGVKFLELVDTLNAMTIDTLDGVDDAIESSQSTIEANPDDPKGHDATCYDGGGSLGWILCPLLESLGKATTFLYEKVIEPFLQVNVELFTGSVESGKGSVGAWGAFRNIANIVLIAFFILILISQISGIGIDNYGIKKLLPKIIVTAVLINLSFIICQLAVDLSNILGFALKNMFDEMANSVNMPTNGEYTAGYTAGGNIISTLVPILTIGIAGLAIWSQGLVAAILAVLATIVAALIGIVFIFALLSVRQAGVILLVVISPVAMACYMLPNTKSLFNKWYKAFQGLLMLYPICGLLIGAGNFASKILLSTDADNFFIALSAMLINIVPFFFIPSLLKSSFAALGNIGARISGISKNVSGRAQRSINQSELAQRKKAEHAEFKRMRRAGLKYDENGNLAFTKRGLRQNSKVGSMRPSAAARLNAERASFSKNATANNKYLGEGAEEQFKLDRVAQEQQEIDSQINNAIASLKGGEMTYMDGDEKKTVDMHDEKSMQDALTYYLQNGKGNEATVKALGRTLSQRGDSGRSAVRNSIDATIAAGGEDLDKSGIRALSTEIMDNFSKDYKENARTTFDFAKNNQTISDNGQIVAPSDSVNAGSLKAATIGGIDDDELKRVTSTFNSESTSEEDKKIIARTAYEALNSESSASIKGKNKEEIEKLAAHHIVKTMDCQKLDTNGNVIRGENAHERISLRGDGKYVNEDGAIVKISSYKVIE